MFVSAFLLIPCCLTFCIGMPSYVLNDRLFPIPINPNACPSCQGHSDDKPSNPPRYIQYVYNNNYVAITVTVIFYRISVPHTTLQAPYKLRPRAKLKSNSAASMSLSQVLVYDTYTYCTIFHLSSIASQDGRQQDQLVCPLSLLQTLSHFWTVIYVGRKRKLPENC